MVDNTQSFDIAAELVLEHLSKHLPLALWSVTRVENNRQTFLYLNEDNAYGVTRGDFTPWPDTFCIHMVEGQTPAITTDPHEVAEYRRAAELSDLTIGTYAGAAINEATAGCSEPSAVSTRTRSSPPTSWARPSRSCH